MFAQRLDAVNFKALSWGPGATPGTLRVARHPSKTGALRYRRGHHFPNIEGHVCGTAPDNRLFVDAVNL
jgi:hypothetical protein